MIYIGSDNSVKLLGLATADGTLINDASVSGELLDSKNILVLSFDFSSDGTQGNYTGLIPADTSLSPKLYTLVITAISDSGTLELRQSQAGGYFNGI